MNGKARLWYSVASVAMSLLLSSGFAVWYVGYQNQKWCDSLAIFTATDPSRLAEPITLAGKQQRVRDIIAYRALVKQRKSFHCPGADK